MRLLSNILCMLLCALLIGCGQGQPDPKFVRGVQLETHFLADPAAVISVHNAGKAGRVEILIEKHDRNQSWRAEEYFGGDETREVRVPLVGCPYPIKLVVSLRPATDIRSHSKETSEVSWGN